MSIDSDTTYANHQDYQSDNQGTKDKNLLVICHFYANFEKDTIDQMAANFSNVYVLVRYNPIAEIARYVPISSLERYQLKNKVDNYQKPDNVHIFIAPIWYAPFDLHYRNIGDIHFHACEKIIDTHHLKFDLIHCHFLWSAGYAGAKLKERYHVPLIVTAHGYDVYNLPFKSPEWKNKIKFVLDRADFIITVSQNNLRYINELTSNKSVIVIPNGFRTDLFYPRDTSECRRMLNLPQDKKIVLTVGRLTPIKGQKFLIEAIRGIISERNDILCVIIGRGELRPALERQIRSLGLENSIRLIGGISHNEIPLWMNACDLFVLPSLQESFGIVQIEAMACGKYIVATSNGGSDEVINSEEYGLLAKTGDPHDLGEKILIALNREYHREAILQYVKRFQWDEISKETSKIYSSVLSRIQSEDDCQPDNQRTKDKNLLVICHFYTNFEKDAIDQVAKNFSKVFVIVRYNPIAEIARYFPIPFLERYQLSNKVDHFHQPDNVSIFIASVWYAPFDSHYRNIGNMHLQACEKIIDAHRLKFDLIHCHFLWSAGYVGAKLKEKYHVPFIVTAHGYDVYTLPFKSPEWRNKIKYVLDRADFIITVSQTNLRYINELTGNQSFKLIPNGFRTDLFYPRDTSECRRMLNLPQDKKIILTVGRLIPVKGHIYLFEAIRNIISKRQDILCLVIGRGELYTPLNHQITLFGLEKYITLIGGKPHDEIPLWMNACDLFVLPSLNEGNPTVMFETLGCGKPFVGSNVGGVPEVITSDAYGFLVNPADSDDLTEKILMALDREWDQEAILRYADHYTWDEISQEIIKIYKSVLS